jgi:uncharacterized membrane protein
MTVTESYTKDATGRGWAVVVYGLLLASIMAVIPALIGAMIAHSQHRRSASWVATHLRFQIRTFWLGAAACALALLAWQLLGYLAAPAMAAWVFGYLFFTALLIWLVGRCAFGIYRLTENRPIDNPRSRGFGFRRR